MTEIELLIKAKGKNSPVVEFYEYFHKNDCLYIITEFCEVLLELCITTIIKIIFFNQRMVI
jgi:hypothetical protein